MPVASGMTPPRSAGSWSAAVTVFLFQAEGGIRYVAVTGVQTCALPICGGPLTVLAPHVAMLGAVLGVAFTAASDGDRAALSLILTHPTTPLAVATGRWLAALTAAGTLVLALLFVTGAASFGPAGLLVRAGAAACGAAAAAAGCPLVAGAAGGNGLAGVLFLP